MTNTNTKAETGPHTFQATFTKNLALELPAATYTGTDKDTLAAVKAEVKARRIKLDKADPYPSSLANFTAPTFTSVERSILGAEVLFKRYKCRTIKMDKNPEVPGYTEVPGHDVEYLTGWVCSLAPAPSTVWVRIPGGFCQVHLDALEVLEYFQAETLEGVAA